MAKRTKTNSGQLDFTIDVCYRFGAVSLVRYMLIWAGITNLQSLGSRLQIWNCGVYLFAAFL